MTSNPSTFRINCVFCSINFLFLFYQSMSSRPTGQGRSRRNSRLRNSSNPCRCSRPSHQSTHAWTSRKMNTLFFRLKIQLKLEQRYWTSFSINRLTTTIIPPRPTQSNHYPCQKGGKKREIRYEVKKRWIRRRRTRSYDVYRKSYLTDQSSSLGDGQGLGRNSASNASHLFVVVAVFDVTHGSFELTLNRFWEDRCKGLLEIRVFRRPGTVSWLG